MVSAPTEASPCRTRAVTPSVEGSPSSGGGSRHSFTSAKTSSVGTSIGRVKSVRRGRWPGRLHTNAAQPPSGFCMLESQDRARAMDSRTRASSAAGEALARGAGLEREAERAQDHARVVAVGHGHVAGLEGPAADPYGAGLAVVDLGLRQIELAREQPLDRAHDARVGGRGPGPEERPRVERRRPHVGREDVEPHAVRILHAPREQPRGGAAHAVVARCEAGGEQRGDHRRGLHGVRVPAPVGVLEDRQQLERAAALDALEEAVIAAVTAVLPVQAVRDEAELDRAHHDAEVEARAHRVDDVIGEHPGDGEARQALRIQQSGQREVERAEIAGAQARDHRVEPAVRVHPALRAPRGAAILGGRREVERGPGLRRGPDVASARERVGLERAVIELLGAQPARPLAQVALGQHARPVQRDEHVRRAADADVAPLVPGAVGALRRPEDALPLGDGVAHALRRISLGSRGVHGPVCPRPGRRCKGLSIGVAIAARSAYALGRWERRTASSRTSRSGRSSSIPRSAFLRRKTSTPS
ncbi:MAG: hypothetical protein M5U28_47095 [Sandaracinaceae bacterium]|nr:hypothetical protein [Sandaracinaceae bacterium]